MVCATNGNHFKVIRCRSFIAHVKNDSLVVLYDMIHWHLFVAKQLLRLLHNSIDTVIKTVKLKLFKLLKANALQDRPLQKLCSQNGEEP